MNVDVIQTKLTHFFFSLNDMMTVEPGEETDAEQSENETEN